MLANRLGLWPKSGGGIDPILAKAVAWLTFDPVAAAKTDLLGNATADLTEVNTPGWASYAGWSAVVCDSATNAQLTGDATLYQAQTKWTLALMVWNLGDLLGSGGQYLLTKWSGGQEFLLRLSSDKLNMQIKNNAGGSYCSLYTRVLTAPTDLHNSATPGWDFITVTISGSGFVTVNLNNGAVTGTANGVGTINQGIGIFRVGALATTNVFDITIGGNLVVAARMWGSADIARFSGVGELGAGNGMNFPGESTFRQGLGLWAQFDSDGTNEGRTGSAFALTEVNTPTYATYLGVSGVICAASASRHLSGDSTYFQMQDESTFAVWVYNLGDLIGPGGGYIVSKWGGTADEYILYLDVLGKLNFKVGTTGWAVTPSLTAPADIHNTANPGWDKIVCRITGGGCSVDLNDGATTATDATATAVQSDAMLIVGGLNATTIDDITLGALVVHPSRAWTAAEVTTFQTNPDYL